MITGVSTLASTMPLRAFERPVTVMYTFGTDRASYFYHSNGNREGTSISCRRCLGVL